MDAHDMALQTHRVAALVYGHPNLAGGAEPVLHVERSLVPLPPVVHELHFVHRELHGASLPLALLISFHHVQICLLAVIVTRQHLCGT